MEKISQQETQNNLIESKKNYIFTHILDENYDIEAFAEFLADQPPKYTSKIQDVSMSVIREAVDKFILKNKPFEEGKGSGKADIGKYQQQPKLSKKSSSFSKSDSKLQFNSSKMAFYMKQIPCIKDSNKFALNKIDVQILSFKKNKGGFMGKEFITYKIELPQLHKIVERRYSDFQWLRQILTQNHPGMVIPPIPKKKAKRVVQDSHVIKKGYMLQCFLAKSLDIQEIRSDQTMYRFLTMDSASKFEDYKKEIKPEKHSLPLEKTKSSTGMIQLGINKECLDRINSGANFFETFNPSIKEIYKQVKRIQQNYNSLCTHFGNLEQICKKLHSTEKLFRAATSSNNEKSIFQSLENIFSVYKDYNQKVKDVWDKQMYAKLKYQFHHSECFIAELAEYKAIQKEFQNKKDELTKKRLKAYNDPISKWDIDPNMKQNFSGQKPAFEKVQQHLLPKKTEQFNKVQLKLAVSTKQMSNSIQHYSNQNNGYEKRICEKVFQKQVQNLHLWNQQLTLKVSQNQLK